MYNQQNINDCYPGFLNLCNNNGEQHLQQYVIPSLDANHLQYEWMNKQMVYWTRLPAHVRQGGGGWGVGVGLGVGVGGGGGILCA